LIDYWNHSVGQKISYTYGILARAESMTETITAYTGELYRGKYRRLGLDLNIKIFDTPG